MKNKLLVSVFAAVVGAFALTSCESKTDVMGLCGDMLKESLHKSPRSLVKLNGQKLTIYEYEFMGGVDDNRLMYRTISFGNGVNEPKSEEIQTYEYGEWGEANNSYTLIVTPAKGASYTLTYAGNALVMPNGLAVGGEGTENTARVDKWEKVIATLPNTAWEGTYMDDLILDSVFRDSIRTTYIPPMTFITDTIKVWTGKMDTIGADTTCYFRFSLNRDAAYANTGHFYMKSARTKYNRKTATADTISVKKEEYDIIWYFSDVSSAAKFSVKIEGSAPAEQRTLNISKYKLDDAGKPAEFLLEGCTFVPYVPVP